MEPRASVEWAKGRLTDAQIESIKAFVGSAVVTLALWNGFPPIGTRFVWAWERDETGEIRRNVEGQLMGNWKKKIKWLPVLYPFKILTVFYHEISHAVVGRLTGGKPTFIMVDPYEGGLTEFALPPHKQPEPKSTLAAGYIGSCIFGCALIFAGFDTLAAKYAAVGILVITLLAIAFCATVLYKSALAHYRHHVAEFVARLFSHKTATDEARERIRAAKRKQRVDDWDGNGEDGEVAGGGKASQPDEPADPDAPTRKDKMVSVDLIGAILLFVLAIFIVVGLWDDSIYFRFIVLGMGVMSALYATWDVMVDGILHGKEGGSDATEMARLYNNSAEKRGRQTRSTAFYAAWWFALEVALIVGTLLGALSYWDNTKAEQALRSRQFLPAPWHYGPADLLQDSKSASSTINGWIGEAEGSLGES